MIATHASGRDVRGRTPAVTTRAPAFAPTFDPAHSTFRKAASVVVHPNYLASPVTYQTPDVAVLMLEHPVPGVDPIRLPIVGAADSLADGTQLTNIGYGFTQDCDTDHGHCQVANQRTRRYATETLISTSRWFITVGQSPNAQGEGGVCHSDSGGPHLLPSTTTAVAITTSILSKWCWSPGRDIRLDTPTVIEFLRRFAALELRRHTMLRERSAQ